VLLLAVVGGVFGYVYITSDVRTFEITGKFTQDGRTRYGMTSEQYVIKTDKGNFELLKFPLLGFTFDAEETYHRIHAGTQIKARVADWPPKFIFSSAKPHILAVY
jgi:hypothetical protein